MIMPEITACLISEKPHHYSAKVNKSFNITKVFSVSTAVRTFIIDLKFLRTISEMYEAQYVKASVTFHDTALRLCLKLFKCSPVLQSVQCV
jgi:hypothetical protein